MWLEERMSVAVGHINQEGVPGPLSRRSSETSTSTSDQLQLHSLRLNFTKLRLPPRPSGIRSTDDRSPSTMPAAKKALSKDAYLASFRDALTDRGKEVAAVAIAGAPM